MATTNAVEILHKRYIGDDPKRLASLAEERIKAKEEAHEQDTNPN